MLTYLRSPAFLALALDALVGADARPQALLARAPDAVMHRADEVRALDIFPDPLLEEVTKQCTNKDHYQSVLGPLYDSDGRTHGL